MPIKCCFDYLKKANEIVMDWSNHTASRKLSYLIVGWFEWRGRNGRIFFANFKQTVHTHTYVLKIKIRIFFLWKEIYIIFHKFLFEFCFSMQHIFVINTCRELWELTVVLYLLNVGFESSQALICAYVKCDRMHLVTTQHAEGKKQK